MQLDFDIDPVVRDWNREVPDELLQRFAAAWCPPATHDRALLVVDQDKGKSLVLDLGRYTKGAGGYFKPASHIDPRRQRESEGLWFLNVVGVRRITEYLTSCIYSSSKAMLAKGLKAYLSEPGAAVVELSRCFRRHP